MSAKVLWNAAEAGDLEEVRHLIDAGLSVNSTDEDGWTPLMFASLGGHVEVVKFLLECGATINACDHDDRTALLLASAVGQEMVVEILQDYSASVDGAGFFTHPGWYCYRLMLKKRGLTCCAQRRSKRHLDSECLNLVTEPAAEPAAEPEGDGISEPCQSESCFPDVSMSCRWLFASSRALLLLFAAFVAMSVTYVRKISWNDTLNEDHEKLAYCMQNQTSRGINNEVYDVVINRQNSLITELNSSGWAIHINHTALEQWRSRKAIYVGMIGLFDVGKTHLLQRLTERTLPSGKGVLTKGISGIYPRNSNDTIVFFDSAGAKRAVEQAKLVERIMTDQFVEDLIILLCDAIVIVVDQLTIDMERKISRLEERIYDQHRDAVPKKQMFIVHNYQHLGDSRSVDQHIQWDIKEAYLGEQKSFGGRMADHRYFYHNRGADRVHHFVYAREDTEAGLEWNNKSIELMRTFFNSMPADKVADPLMSVLQILPEVLRDYVQPLSQPIDERNETLVKEVFKHPRGAIKHMAGHDPTEGQQMKYVTVLGRQEAVEKHYAVELKDNLLLLATPRTMHFWPNPGSGKQYSPSMSILSSPEEWVIEVDLPGIPRSQLLNAASVAGAFGVAYTIRQKKRLLVLKGVRPRSNIMTARTERGYTYQLQHRASQNRYEPFVVAVQLPPDVYAAKPTVGLTDGVLTLRFRKLVDDESEHDYWPA